MLDLNEVSMFVEVVRAGSFAEAARRLGMPSNSISRRVQQLEAELGARLLQRSTRKLSLTSAGKTLYERCADPIAAVSQAGRAIIDGKGVPQGVIRITAPANFFDFFSMAWIKEFLHDFALVKLEFVLSDANVDMVEESIDVAFRDVAKSSSLSKLPLFPPHSGLVASPSYLAAQGTPASPQDLARHDCLPLMKRTGASVWRLSGPDGISEVTVTGRFKANTAGAALEAAIAGLGITLLPSILTLPHTRSGRLVPVLPEYCRDDGGLSGGLYAVLPSRQQVPAAVSAFVAFATGKLASTDVRP
ncbi:LysR family transcriptional regulator [Undibacterium sp.]|jgi:DNA-binding transcriptional LysR family regulator|uniref:LysR family transcriptional regulator n=1 Tax=Undibacterium sp. TaxID=1914977 RepID=UPI002B8D45B1|nr:LysR family transcriptional regulator [Undibacterium sp.]HTD04841.1 LysR family transcriptional regulator [Undibacterium sp.]